MATVIAPLQLKAILLGLSAVFAHADAAYEMM
jgi:hypothetical protein